MQKRTQIAFLFILIFFSMIIILGFIGQVGILTVLKRVGLYVPLFSFLVLLINFLMSIWIDAEEPIIKTKSKLGSKGKSKGNNHQASELGKSLDIRDTDETSFYNNKGQMDIESMKIEPQKAAKAIREMLSEDKND